MKSIYVPKDRTTSLTKGFAFCEFQCEKDAKSCIEQLNGKIIGIIDYSCFYYNTLGSRSLVVNKCREMSTGEMSSHTNSSYYKYSNQTTNNILDNDAGPSIASGPYHITNHKEEKDENILYSMNQDSSPQSNTAMLKNFPVMMSSKPNQMNELLPNSANFSYNNNSSVTGSNFNDNPKSNNLQFNNINVILK